MLGIGPHSSLAFYFFSVFLLVNDFSQPGNVHLDFNEVWSAKSNKVGIVLHVGSVVPFEKSEPVDSSLTLQKTAIYVLCITACFSVQVTIISDNM